MAGMEVLGRNADVIMAAAGQSFKMRNASSAMIVCSTSSLATGNTFTVNESVGFTGSLVPVNVIKNVYWSTAANGTVAWNKQTYNSINLQGPYLTAGGPLSAIQLATASTTVPVTATLAVFHVFTSQLSDPNNYIQITVSGAGTGLVTVVLSDLMVQRAPANLEIKSA